jgi:hypothetical protein
MRSPLVVYCAMTAAASRIAVLLCLVHRYAFKADTPTYHVELHTNTHRLSLSPQYQLNCAAFDGGSTIPWISRVLLSDRLDNSDQQPHHKCGR